MQNNNLHVCLSVRLSMYPSHGWCVYSLVGVPISSELALKQRGRLRMTIIEDRNEISRGGFAMRHGGATQTFEMKASHNS